MNIRGGGRGHPDEGLSLLARLIAHSLTDKLLSDYNHLFTRHWLEGLQPTRRFGLSAQKCTACVFWHYHKITDLRPGAATAATMRGRVIRAGHAAARVHFMQLHQ